MKHENISPPSSRSFESPRATLVLLRSKARLELIERQEVRRTLRRVCSQRHWNLEAVDVGRHHVRVVIEGHDCSPTELLGVLKGELRTVGLESSTTFPPQPLYTARQITEACCEVLFEDSRGPYVIPSSSFGALVAE